MCILITRRYHNESNAFDRVLLACIKYLGKHPCPRCLVEKFHIHELGSKADLRRRDKLERIDDNPRQFDVESARKLIYTQGVRINSKRIAAILDPKSLVPTRVSIFLSYILIFTTNVYLKNAFSERLAPLGFNFYSMFAPDLLHEIELGVWKGLFTHLLRILYAAGGDTIVILNSRCTQHIFSVFPSYLFTKIPDIVKFQLSDVIPFENLPTMLRE